MREFKKCEWHGTDWESRGYNSTKPCFLGYEIHIANAKSQYSLIAEFAIKDEMERVIKLWNATRHLSDKDLESMCSDIVRERDFILKNLNKLEKRSDTQKMLEELIKRFEVSELTVLLFAIERLYKDFIK